jgi:hypothetical protein
LEVNSRHSSGPTEGRIYSSCNIIDAHGDDDDDDSDDEGNNMNNVK